MKPRPPKPRTPIFDVATPDLGRIPGPLRVDVVGDTIWAAGGHDFSAVLRHANGRWTATVVDPLLNFVVGVSATEAIVGGAGGRVGRTTDGGATWAWSELGGAWLVCASRDTRGRVWIGQQGGRVHRAEAPGAPFAAVATVDGDVNTVRQLDGEATRGIVVTPRAIHRLELATGKISKAMFSTKDANLIDAACAPDGRIVAVADRGRGWLASGEGAKFAAIELGAGERYDFDAVFWVDPWFCALGYDGALRVSLDGHAWRRVAVEKHVRRLGGIAAYRGGWLVGALRMASNDQVGVLSYLGDPAAAPVLPAIATDAEDDHDAIAGLDAEARAARFVIAERNALAWDTVWRELPGAEAHANRWMKIAARYRS